MGKFEDSGLILAGLGAKNRRRSNEPFTQVLISYTSARGEVAERLKAAVC